MKRLATIALAVLFVASLSSTIVAERTALSIGGKVELMAAYEENTGSAGAPTLGTSGNDNRVEEKINLDIDADMTDNVSVHIGLEQTGAWGAVLGGATGPTIDGQTAALAVDEAYIVVKELIIEQLTVKAGVQMVEYSLRNDGNALFLSAPEMGAWKATLNYDPLYVDLTIATVVETRNTMGAMDTALYALGIEYYLENKGKVQVIIFSVTNEDADISLVEYSAGVTYMVMEDLEIFVQIGGQGGEWGDGNDTNLMAFNLGAEYTFSKVNRKPYVGLSYMQIGGSDDAMWVNFGDVDETVVLEADRGLRDHNNGYQTKILVDNYSVIRLVGGCVVDEKTTVDAGLGIFQLVDDAGVSANQVAAAGDDSVGMEIDVKVSHKLTDDLTVGVGLGYVMSGDAIENTGDDEALVGLYATATLNF
jgi:hypothetical protein